MTSFDRWLESGPGGPHDDEEIECEHCDGTGTVLIGRDERDYPCSTCSGTGRALVSDESDNDCNEDDLTDAEADADALEGAGLGSEGF